jgi:hypothetical protein
LGFDLYIGIDYSGAETSDAKLAGLQAYAARPGRDPEAMRPERPRHWSRRELALWLLTQLRSGKRLLVGIDHGFSFPDEYFRRYHLDSWPTFLADFCRHWPTDQPECSVQCIRDGTWWKGARKPRGQRTGPATALRLCERWTSSSKSVFRFDFQGSVAKSTHAGIPWLRFLREEGGDRIFFWPFDGWQPHEGKSVIAEVYPSIFRHRYAKGGRTPDEHDAYAVARWLEETGRKRLLDRYFNPPLTPPERRVAALEGWILGIA